MENEQIIARFLALRPTGSGYGDGSGDGSGDGYGYGYGDGYGSGYGYGDGYGYGSGDGYGDGYGYGYGDGYGYGYGYGDGSGDGSGYVYGDGIKEINGQRVYMIDDVPTLIDRVRGDYAKGSIIRDDLSLQPCYVARVGNSFAHGDTLHQALADATAKELEDQPIEERIARFVAEFPDPDKAVPFKSLYTWHHVLTGSCTMGRDEFTRSHSLDTAKDYTPRYFIEITAHAYGGEAIRQLAESYGIKIE